MPPSQVRIWYVWIADGRPAPTHRFSVHVGTAGELGHRLRWQPWWDHRQRRSVEFPGGNMLARRRRRLRRPARSPQFQPGRAKLTALKNKNKNWAFNGTPGRVWHWLVVAPTILNCCPHQLHTHSSLSRSCPSSALFIRIKNKPIAPLCWIIITFKIKLKIVANSPALPEHLWAYSVIC